MSKPSCYAVFGHPIAHSQSPRIHQCFAAQTGITLSYKTIDATPEALSTTVHHFFTNEGGHGANVTLPHKAAARALAHECSRTAMRAGCVNVLTLLAGGQLAAHNTDGSGLVRDLSARHALQLRGKHLLLLGAGGAARGVAWQLLETGIASLTIVNRSPAAADTLADMIGDVARVGTRCWQDLATIGPVDIIINATSAGVFQQSLNLPTTLIGAHTVCYDLAYGASARLFLDWSQAVGARRTLDGLGMLVETAADAFELWHGLRPATEPVYQALRSTC